MSYVGQPRLCRKCTKPGDVMAQCTAVVCKTAGHETKDCQASKNCNLCGEAGHLYRPCPKRACTYAHATTGAAASTPRVGETLPTTAKTPAERGNRDEDSPTTSSPQAPEGDPQHLAQEGELMEEGEQQEKWMMVMYKKHQKVQPKEQRPEGAGKSKNNPKKRSLSLTEGSNLSSSEDELTVKSQRGRQRTKTGGKEKGHAKHPPGDREQSSG
ncbi:uncharacterized protein LOC116982682 [Amblyraja radiata]|uniref:uncharacterized protein LOC116982682 n=1 Tax=Amblyraja radiata TaxID=386614 RepID=UPI00140366F4|nr:uncharacterized protein LOC116982682 [Amblyraja radiata]